MTRNGSLPNWSIRFGVHLICSPQYKKKWNFTLRVDDVVDDYIGMRTQNDLVDKREDTLDDALYMYTNMYPHILHALVCYY